MGWEKLKGKEGIATLGLYVLDVTLVGGKVVAGNANSGKFYSPGSRPVSREEFTAAFKAMGLSFASVPESGMYGSISEKRTMPNGSIWAIETDSLRINDGARTEMTLISGFHLQTYTVAPVPREGTYVLELVYGKSTPQQISFSLPKRVTDIVPFLTKLGVSAATYTVKPGKVSGDQQPYDVITFTQADLSPFTGMIWRSKDLTVLSFSKKSSSRMP